MSSPLPWVPQRVLGLRILLKRALLGLLLGALSLGVLEAQTSFPRIDPDPRALSFYRPDPNSYTWLELAEISLWSSGADSQGIASGLNQIRGMAEAIRAAPDLPPGERERAEFVLDYMHRHLLRTYSFTQTRMDTMLSTGRFNCVSSAALYIILCRSLGIQVSGVVTRDHAFAQVQNGGQNIDVETTNRLGFDPGGRRDFHDEFGRLTGFAYVPAANYRDRQTIRPIELVSLILRNRIAEHEGAQRFAEAVPLAVDRAALLLGPASAASAAAPGAYSIFFEDPAANLLDRILNYGAWHLRNRREEEGLRWAALASPRFEDPRRWQEFIFAAVNNRLNRYVQGAQPSSQQFREAWNFLDWSRPLLDPPSLEQFRSLLTDTELAARANRISTRAEGDTFIEDVLEARREDLLDQGRAAELITFAVQRGAQIISAPPGRDWLGAIQYIEGALARFGANRSLEQALLTYQNNRAADFHNRFAAAWNRRDYDEAERILNEGLAEFPTNRQLLSNRESIMRNRPQER